MGIEGNGSIIMAITSTLILGFALWIINRMSNL